MRTALKSLISAVEAVLSTRVDESRGSTCSRYKAHPANKSAGPELPPTTRSTMRADSAFGVAFGHVIRSGRHAAFNGIGRNVE